MKLAIITTTINVPELVLDYATDSHKFGHSDVEFIIAGDHKTPHEATGELCSRVLKESGIQCHYLDIEDQNQFLKPYPRLKEHLLWNSIQRRNVAILKAYSTGCDVIVTIDDDNYITTENYISHHLQLTKHQEMNIIHSSDGWFNICDTLTERNNRVFFPRGYPADPRQPDIAPERSSYRDNVRSVVNAGFWLDDPDIDAVTRLASPVEVTGYQRDEQFSLAKGTWAPFNSQNTAIAREVIPAYFLSPYIGRYDDIWASYIVQRVAETMGDSISFGLPLVTQKRNPHNLFSDYELEKFGYQFCDIFCHWLRETTPQGDSYLEKTRSLVKQMRLFLKSSPNLETHHREAFEALWDGYDIWCDIIEQMEL